jgi:hypothetical protein
LRLGRGRSSLGLHVPRRLKKTVAEAVEGALHLLARAAENVGVDLAQAGEDPTGERSRGSFTGGTSTSLGCSIACFQRASNRAAAASFCLVIFGLLEILPDIAPAGLASRAQSEIW